MRRSLMGWLAVMVASIYSTPAAALTTDEKILFFGKDDRIAVDARAKPWLAVVKWSTQRDTLCSAALVEPDLLVSAAHCLLTERGRLDRGRWAYVGYRNGRYLHRRAIIESWMPPAFKRGLSYRKDGVYIDPSVAHLDIAFLRLSKPFPRAVGRFLLAPGERIPYLRLINALGWKATQSGYAGDQEERQLAHPNCRLTRVNRNLTLNHRCDTLEGDSGSPIFALVNGQPTLLAIQSSAPDAAQRNLADNIAIGVPAWFDEFERWRASAAKEPTKRPPGRK